MANPGTELASLDFGNLIGGPLVAVITAQSLAAEATAKFIKETGFYPDTLDNDGNITSVGSPIYVDFKYPKEIEPYQPALAAVAGVVTGAKVTTEGSGYTPNQDVIVTFTAATSQGETAAEGTVKADPSGEIPLDTQITITNPGEYFSATAPTATIDAPTGGGTTALTIDITYSGYVEEVSAVPAVYQEMKISVPILTMLPIPFIKVDIVTIDFNAKINSMETSTSRRDTSVSGSLSARAGGRLSPVKVKFTGSVSFKKSTISGSKVERTFSMAIHVQASQDEMPAGMEKLLNLLESAMVSKPGEITSNPTGSITASSNAA